MPVFHTKTIENILDPVAQQVSRLVILHEEAEDGNAMPDLARPVSAVSQAVRNLVNVGRETIYSSDDDVLKQDMPSALHRVESASRLLEEASDMLKQDPFSYPARKKLIEGSRGILQGTSSLLLCFDESEVRKIVRDSKKVLEYLAVAEVVDSLEDLVRFVQDLSPCLSKVSRDVDGRQQELTHQVHREALLRCMEEVKTLTPILICSMKIYIQIHTEGGKGDVEAGVNRDYLVQRMTDEINEIIRVLQLTTYDEDQWDSDNLTALRRALATIQGLLQPARDWLRDSRALSHGIGEKSTRKIINEATKVSERCPPQYADSIKKLCDNLSSMANGLCELRQNGDGSLAPAESLGKGIELKLDELNEALSAATQSVEKSGKFQPAQTVSGQLDQARKWLETPLADDKGLGQRAISSIVEQGRKVANCLPSSQRVELDNLCDGSVSLLNELRELHHTKRDSEESQEKARKLLQKLTKLRNEIQVSVIHRIVEDFMDTVTPLKQFTETVTSSAVHIPEQFFSEKAAALERFTNRASKTARMVAAGGCGDQKKLSESLLNSSLHLENLAPQLINGGRIRLAYPENQAANEHFENLKLQYEDSLNRLRLLCDNATDSKLFILLSGNAIRNYSGMCEDAISQYQASKMVDHTSTIARLTNRVLMVARQEADNSEDANFIQGILHSADDLQTLVPALVYSAKDVALNISNEAVNTKWRDVNKKLISAVDMVGRCVHSNSSHDPLDFASCSLIEPTPVRPPLPGGFAQPPRPPPPPETDDEDTDDMFCHIPLPNQPIMLAAHGLHQEVKQWSSKDNEIVSSAKRMALLMARLSQLVRGEGGTKKDLIACAKEIAESSEEVTKLAKELAHDCTDKRMRTNLLQVCERIPTIGTQLKILSTVKATMLGAQGTEEDREATEMLVGNAQNLMQSVKETVRAAEAASIKMRTDAGIRMRWVRKQPWYQY